MTNTNATNFRKNLFEYLNQVAVYNDIINVTTKNGNVVVLSEEDYSSMMETLYIASHPKTANEIVESLHEPLEDGTPYVPGEEW